MKLLFIMIIEFIGNMFKAQWMIKKTVFISFYSCFSFTNSYSL